MTSKLNYKFMKYNCNILKLLILPNYRVLAILSIISIISLTFLSNNVIAAVQTSFLYTLSNFSGPVPYSSVGITVDRSRNEVYIINPKENDIRVFNDQGMEIYRFGEDGSLGRVYDLAVKKDGNIIVLSKRNFNISILLCNFRGEPVSTLELKNFPPEFSGFIPTRMICQHELLYLLDSGSLRLAVTDTDGVFQKGYDLGLLAAIEESKRAQTAIGGFSVDREGNMLFTIPVLFAAYKLTPDGNLVSFGKRGSTPGTFNIVGAIAVDDRGYYYVADKLKSAILIFDTNFTFQYQFGLRGLGPDNLVGPRDLALGEGKLYVSQLLNRGVSVFKLTYQP
jgi:DNA-binding beta-propeller fold protein YncE